MTVAELKNVLAEFNQQQKADFALTEPKVLIRQRSDFYDCLLLDLWQSHGLAERGDLALIAVGGYGRREMFPLSDLDILVLSENPLDEATHHQLHTLFNLLWDSKLQLGTSVRTLAECVSVGQAEISVATNMLESRFLFGDHALWQRLMGKLQQADFWTMADFYQAKIAEKNDRYARYHNTSYNLEPDLKHSPGGLRDLHLLGWIMLRHYGTQDWATLTAQGVLFPEEYRTLREAEAVLFRMRFGLHLLLKRYDNRLRFDRQLQLSELLGYQGEGNAPVEAMMKTFFQATQTISQLSQLLLDSFSQAVLFPQKNTTIQPLDRYFGLQDQHIHCFEPHCFQTHPCSILDLFFHLTQHPQAEVSAMTYRQLRLALQQRQQPLSELPDARQRFIQIIEQPKMVARAIVPMHQLGVLSAYLPQWQGIEGLMQFDLFHIYTVDEHTVRVMLKLESFLSPENQLAHPICTTLFPQMQNRKLLYLAALFHDIAKGRGGDHAELGAIDTYLFAKQHGFSESEATLMSWLVAEHLTMSITAQRRDIHDPNVVKQFAETVGEQSTLEALTCLTVADICATNETLWNDWKRTLLAQLFQFTRQQLQIGKQKSIDYQQVGLNHRLQASEQLKLILDHQQWQQLQYFWQQCPPDYFVRNSAKQLEWHIQGWLDQPSLPLVLVSNQYARAETEIFIHCADQPQLFGRIAQRLNQLKISIHDAQILTGESGLVFDSFIVTESHGKMLTTDRCLQIEQALRETLSSLTPLKPSKRTLKHQSFQRPTKVQFLANHRPDQTAFELFTLDRDGLLAQISQIFNELNLIVQNAKISTIGERVEDFFAISTNEGKALNQVQQQALKSKLLEGLA